MSNLIILLLSDSLLAFKPEEMSDEELNRLLEQLKDSEIETKNESPESDSEKQCNCINFAGFVILSRQSKSSRYSLIDNSSIDGRSKLCLQLKERCLCNLTCNPEIFDRSKKKYLCRMFSVIKSTLNSVLPS